MTTAVLSTLLPELGVLQADLARATSSSKAVISRLVAKGEWPALRAEELRRKVVAFLKSKGATAVQLRALLTPIKKSAPPSCELGEAIPEARTTETTEDHMLLRCETLTPAARRHFGLTRNPFIDEIHTADDVFQSPSVRYVRNVLHDCAMNHGFIAVVGQSGAGKTTLVKDMESRIRAAGQDILVIKPYTLAMEENDITGKTLKASHLTEAIADALNPALKVKSSPQARFKQVHDLLLQSYREGRRHMLVIEEAHCIPTATLSHLKRFLDQLTDGFRRLIGIALIAQPELLERLNSQNPRVREVMQRCEIVLLDPLDNELQPYLAHKFQRAGIGLDTVLEPDAIDAMRARLIQTPRGGKASEAKSICHPLVVQNLLARAMNAAVEAGFKRVDAQVVEAC